MADYKLINPKLSQRSARAARYKLSLSRTHYEINETSNIQLHINHIKSDRFDFEKTYYGYMYTGGSGREHIFARGVQAG